MYLSKTVIDSWLPLWLSELMYDRNNRLTKKRKTKSWECDVLRGFGKLRHIPRNLGLVHKQGFALTQEGPD